MNISDFFKPLILSKPPSDLDYSKIELLLEAVDAFSRTTNHCVYIIDYYKKGFLYVSDNPIFLCGNTPQSVMNSGYLFYFNNVPQNELEMLLKINQAGFEFYSSIPVSERKNYSISYDFHLIQKSKKLILVNHHLTPLVLDKDANIWLALCVVSHSSKSKAGNVKITKKGSSEVFEFDLIQNIWIKRNRIEITPKEKEILTLSIRGFSIKAIADELKIKIVTVKFHRKNILKKLDVKNISEAVSYVVNNKIL